MEPSIWLMIGFIIGSLGAALLVSALLSRRARQQERWLIQTYEERLHHMDEQRRKDIEQARRQSVEQSRHTIKGQIGERMAPLLPGFEFSPADARFIGHPVDYVVFHGYTDLCDGNGSADDIEVVILDIKRTKARLSKEQQAIMAAVKSGRVRFHVVRLDDQGNVTSSPPGYHDGNHAPA